MKNEKSKPPNKKDDEQGHKGAATHGDPRLQYMAGLNPNAKAPVVAKHRGQICSAEIGNVLKAEGDTDGGILPSSEAMCVSQPLTAADLDRVRACDHEWVVFSTALQEVWLMLQCAICGAHGSVNDPTGEEWGQAFYAPDHPYAWTNKSRVTIRGLAPVRYVERISFPESDQK